MSSFSVKTRVGLNGLGKAGAALFVGGPVVGAVLYARMANAIAGNVGARFSWQVESLIGYQIGMTVCALAALVGFVLLIVGREYAHDVKVNSTKP